MRRSRAWPYTQPLVLILVIKLICRNVLEHKVLRKIFHADGLFLVADIKEDLVKYISRMVRYFPKVQKNLEKTKLTWLGTRTLTCRLY